MKKYILILLLFVYVLTINAQTQLPIGGIEVLGANPMSEFKLNKSSGEAEYKTVSVEGQSFKEAAQLSTLAPPKNIWDIQFSAASKIPVEYNDVMLVTFYGRMISTKDEIGQSTVICVFEKAGPEYDKSLSRAVNFDKEWKLYSLPFSMGGMYAAGGTQLNFQLGTAKQQVVEIADVKVFNYKKTLKESSLPKTLYTYKGREADASWRKIADDNIDKYRKADISFQLKDKKGLPIIGAEISVEMKKHSFGWGTAVDAGTFVNNDTYRNNFYKNFNKVVFENDLKWPE